MVDDKRFWEIDLIRGVAIILMIVFHVCYDLTYFDIYHFPLKSTGFILLMRIIGVLFLLLVGVSLTLSYSRVKKTSTPREIKAKFVKRGLMIFCLGMIITIATWVFLGEGVVMFGVLHCIGVCIIIAYPLLRFQYTNLLIGTLLIMIGVVLQSFSFDFFYLIWLGFFPKGFFTLDYFPLLPWFGVVLVGVFLGNKLYTNYERQFSLKDYKDVSAMRGLCFLGRHSIVIYFLHHIILLSVIYLFLMI